MKIVLSDTPDGAQIHPSREDARLLAARLAIQWGVAGNFVPTRSRFGHHVEFTEDGASLGYLVEVRP